MPTRAPPHTFAGGRPRPRRILILVGAVVIVPFPAAPTNRWEMAGTHWRSGNDLLPAFAKSFNAAQMSLQTAKTTRPGRDPAA